MAARFEPFYCSRCHARKPKDHASTMVEMPQSTLTDENLRDATLLSLTLKNCLFPEGAGVQTRHRPGPEQTRSKEARP